MSTNSEPATPTSLPTGSSRPDPTQGREAIKRIYSAAINLTALDAEIGSIAEMLSDEDPEVVAQATADLEILLAGQEDSQLTLIDRCDTALCIADVLIGQAAMRRAQSKRLQALAQADETLIERLQTVSIKLLRLAHPDKNSISLPMHELKSRKSQAVIVNEDITSDDYVDPEKLPENLRRVTYAPDKTAIKDFLKAGGVYKGLALENRRSWSIDGAK
ncbi:MAG: siphovirus Gp157 family protein [Cyanobium sp. 49614_E6]|jgi:hypothetical protein|nr:siphovirus Gp157 family protein [Cyanobium sp. 49614_E6]